LQQARQQFASQTTQHQPIPQSNPVPNSQPITWPEKRLWFLGLGLLIIFVWILSANLIVALVIGLIVTVVGLLIWGIVSVINGVQPSWKGIFSWIQHHPRLFPLYVILALLLVVVVVGRLIIWPMFPEQKNLTATPTTLVLPTEIATPSPTPTPEPTQMTMPAPATPTTFFPKPGTTWQGTLTTCGSPSECGAQLYITSINDDGSFNCTWSNDFSSPTGTDYSDVDDCSGTIDGKYITWDGSRRIKGQSIMAKPHHSGILNKDHSISGTNGDGLNLSLV
jgi:hypothetical protein